MKKRNFSLRGVFWAVRFAVALYRQKMQSRPSVNIFYATETGTTKRYAEKLRQTFDNEFNVNFSKMSE
jgi:sulfite reductase alpha subunit-like flavoprotein